MFRASILALCAVCVTFLTMAGATPVVVPAANLQEAPYAPWAHSHWVWLSSNQSNQTAVLEFVKGFIDHNITVGAIDIDSEWSTGINNFIVDTAKYPDMKGLIDQMHSQDIKVIFWTTSMVDTTSSNYDYGVNHTYFVRNMFKENTPLHWWHGNGQLLDYTNPEAVAWWHSQLDNVLDLGLDGWKTDGTGPFIMEYIVPQAHSGPISFRDYENMYYGDFFNYTRQKNGEHCLIMSRPVDSYPLLDAALSAYLVFSPRYVEFSGWVGDQDPTFPGLQDAMRNIIHSAWHNFPNFGSDIGGYRTGPGVLGRTKELFIRWFQMGAFVPLMENGGNKEHRPWAFDEPGSTFVVDLYRQFVSAHLELGPYLLSTGTTAYYGGKSSITPMQPKPKSLPLLQFNDIDTYAYLLGDQILVNPVVHANASSVNVSLPAGSSWYDYFHPAETHAGGQNISYSTPLQAFPVFHKTASLLALNVSDDEMGHGDAANGGGLTFLLHTPSEAGGDVEVNQWKAGGVRATYALTRTGAAPNGACGITADLEFTVSATTEAVTLLLQNVAATVDTDVALVDGSRGSAAAPALWTHGLSTSGVAQVIVPMQVPKLGARLTVAGLHVPCVGTPLLQ